MVLPLCFVGVLNTWHTVVGSNSRMFSGDVPMGSVSRAGSSWQSRIPVEIISSETFCAVLFSEVVFSVDWSERENNSGKGFS